MSGKEARVELPEALRRELRASGQQLKACAVVEGDRNYLVLVYRAEYGGGVPPARPPGVVRFSRSEHSTRVAPRIVLSSPQYYRDLEEQSAPPGEQAQARWRGSRPRRETGPPGIGDRTEARYQKRYELDEFHRRFAPAPVNAPVTGSAELTYGTGGFWILGTSVEPDTSRDFERLRKEFPQYDCATTISDPSALAPQLGKDFGSRHGEEAVPANAFVPVVGAPADGSQGFPECSGHWGCVIVVGD